MRHFLDTEIHQEPLAAAVILFWLAESHAKARHLKDGILIPWAMLGIGLVATESTLESLPQKKQTLAGWLRSEGARSWRGYSKQTILAWKDAFWAAFAHGEAAGILTIEDGRLVAKGKIGSIEPNSHSQFVRRAARAIGGTIGGEQDDLRVASALGLEFEV
ncbi:hypothetical protein [Marinobacter sp. W-8]|uniref:hypothetical protein n=1 Tax=Marinobacter sp. W-8 TaxID=3369658 RepID=UPI0037C94D85